MDMFRANDNSDFNIFEAGALSGPFTKALNPHPGDPLFPILSYFPAIRCDHCGMFPIVGIRYKCAQCKDFDVTYQ